MYVYVNYVRVFNWACLIPLDVLLGNLAMCRLVLWVECSYDSGSNECRGVLTRAWRFLLPCLALQHDCHKKLMQYTSTFWVCMNAHHGNHAPELTSKKTATLYFTLTIQLKYHIMIRCKRKKKLRGLTKLQLFVPSNFRSFWVLPWLDAVFAMCRQCCTAALAISTTRSTMKLPSVSINTASPWIPPKTSGTCTATQSWMLGIYTQFTMLDYSNRFAKTSHFALYHLLHKSKYKNRFHLIWVFPTPGAPQNSVILVNGTPPPSISSNFWENVTMDWCDSSSWRASSAVHFLKPRQTINKWGRNSRVTF